MEIESLKNAVRNRFVDITNAYIEPEFRNNSVLRQAIPDNFVATNVDKDQLSTFVNALFQPYTTFRDMYLNNGMRFDPTVDAVKYRNYSSNLPYATITSASLLNANKEPRMRITDVDNKASSTTTEINLSNFLIKDQSLEKNLNNIRRLYSVLETGNYQRYKLLNRNKLNKPSQNVINLYSDKQELLNADTATQNLPTYYQLFDQMRNQTIKTKDLAGPSYNGTASELNIVKYGNDTTVSNLPSIQLPNGVIGDDMYTMAPANKASTTKVSSKTLKLRDAVGAAGATRYFTVSFYARMREAPGSTSQVADKDTVSMSIELLFNNKTTITSTSEEKSINVVRGIWKKITIKRSLSLPAGVTQDVELLCKLNIRHPTANNDASSFAVVVTGFQIDEDDSATVQPSTFKAPEFGDTTNLIVVRRLLLLYELMATYYMGIFILEKNYDSGGDNGKYARAISYLINEYILNFNNNLISNRTLDGEQNTMLGYLNDRVATRFNDYSDKYKSVQSTTLKINDMKDAMNSNIDILNGQTKKVSSLNTLTIVALILTAFVIVSCIVVYLMPLEPGKKLAAAGVASLLGISIMIAFKWILGSQIEPFIDLNSSPAYTGVDSLRTESQKYNLSFALEYLQNTINVALTMTTYNTYGAVNYALTKENAYFSNVRSQLETSTQKINDVNGAYSLQDYSSRARIAFFINIAIVVAITIGGVMLTESIPFIRNIILIAGSIWILLVILLYMVDVSRRVRTSGQKVYWLQPTTSV